MKREDCKVGDTVRVVKLYCPCYRFRCKPEIKDTLCVIKYVEPPEYKDELTVFISSITDECIGDWVNHSQLELVSKKTELISRRFIVAFSGHLREQVFNRLLINHDIGFTVTKGTGYYSKDGQPFFEDSYTYEFIADKEQHRKIHELVTKAFRCFSNEISILVISSNNEAEFVEFDRKPLPSPQNMLAQVADLLDKPLFK